MKKLLVIWMVFGGWLTSFCLCRAADVPPRLYRDKIDPHWLAESGDGGSKFWYRLELPGGQQEFILVDAQKGERAPAFDHSRVAEALSKLLGHPVDARALPVQSLTFSPDAKTLTLHGHGDSWTLDLATYALTSATKSADQEHHLPTQHLAHPSRDPGEETTVRFVNHLPQEVNLFWLDNDGKRQPYGSVPAGGEYEQHTYARHTWLVAAKNGDLIAVFDAEDQPGLAVVGDPTADTKPAARNRRRRDRAGDPPAGNRSPDRRWEVTVQDGNLFLRDTTNDRTQQITHDAKPGNGYARTSESERSTGMAYDLPDPARPTPEVYWSSDSRHFVAMRYVAGTQRRVYLVQSSPKDQLQPKLESYPYLKAGDDVPYAKPHLFEAEAAREIPVDEKLFANPWTIDGLRWNPDGGEFTFQFNQRGHQAFRILGINAATGAVRPIVDEASKTFICYSQKFFVEYLDETGEIVWMSERDGWNHLYLYDAKEGQVKNQITKGGWVVRGVDLVDREKRQVWFHASGVNPGENPYNVNYYRVNLDGTGLTALTGGDGTHSVQYSPDKRFLIDVWSRVNQPTINDLRRTEDGKLLCRLEEADASEVLTSGWQAPEPFIAKGRDGTTDIYGVIHRPRHFDPQRSYPVLEDIYAGPTESYAPTTFSTHYGYQELADRGFIVVQINGMGTNGRSKAFHDVCWKNLADAGFPDRILWIKAAAAKYPSLDLNRVGIFGGSAGGQNAMRALLDHGDFYKAAVADSGCHDNRMDKIWWNEQWMGWPVDESYARSSNVVDAPKLRGKLLLMVGEVDKNVDPASTMQVVNALVKADKDFELFVMPNMGHGVASSPYGRRRQTNFLIRNLLETAKP